MVTLISFSFFMFGAVAGVHVTCSMPLFQLALLLLAVVAALVEPQGRDFSPP